MRRRLAIILSPLVAAGCGLGAEGLGALADAGTSGEGPVADGSPTQDSTLGDGAGPRDGALADGAPDARDSADDVVDSSGGADSAPDAAIDAQADAGLLFGDDCPPGTIYEDDFSTDPTGRWMTVAGTWTWDSTNRVYTVSGQNPHGVIWIGPRPTWTNYTLEVSVRVDTPNGNAGPIFRVGTAGTPPAPNNAGTMYYMGGVIPSSGGVVFGLMKNNAYSQQGQTTAVSVSPGAWALLSVVVSGSSIQISVDGTLGMTLTDATYTNGSIGLRTYKSAFSVRDVKVTCN